MNKIFKKENIMPVAVLGVICIVVAALLGLVNSFTSKEIETQRLEAANAGKLEVLPGLDVNTMEEITPDGSYPKEVKNITKFDIGYVIETETKGNASGMVVLVGIDNDGKVTGVKVIKNGETPSYWATVEPVVTGNDGKYNGMTAETLEAQLVSGATNSSKGVHNAVKTALDAFTVAGGGTVELPPEYTPPVCHRDEAELLALMTELVPDNAGFTDVDFDAEGNNAQYLARVFKENGSLGYVAYVSSISSYYGNVDTENLIHIDNTGKIKSVKNLTWAVSDAAPEYGYNPPNEEKLAEFFEGLGGKDSTTIGEVDLHTGATNTTTTLVATITEALNIVSKIIKEDMPTPEDKVKELAAELIGAESADFTDVTPDDGKYIKKIYKDNGGRGYVAYVSSISANYGTVDTENLIHIGADGKIKGIKKITWSVSDAAPNWGYNPPSDERLSELYASLNGKNSATIGEVDLKTGATNTTTILVDTVKEALAAVEELIKADMPTSEEEIKAIATELIGATPDFTDVTPEGMTYVKKIYRDSKSRGYIAYVYSISAHYGTVDTENVIYIGADGKISGIKKITWSVSDAAPDWGYNPPSEERVSEIYASLNGKNSTTIGEIDLKTGATNTTTTLINSITEALTATADIISKDMPTSEEEIKALAIELIGSNSGLTDVTPKDTSLVRRLYKDNDGNGFIAYLVAISPSYGTVETETLVFIGNDGRIFHVEKLLWKTSDALWGYEPPKESTVNAFYEKLNGHNLEEFKACFTGENPVLVTNATSTTSRLVEVIIAAFEAVKNLPSDEEDVTPDVTPDVQNNTARVIGAVALAVIIVAIAAYIAVPKIIRRRNEDE